MLKGIDWFRTAGQLEWGLALGALGLIILLMASRLWASNTLRMPAQWVWVKPLLRIAALGLLGIAFLGPAKKDIKKEVEAKGKDIMILLDLSRSMMTQDIAPSRLQKIKFVLKEITQKFYGDRVGLIIFSNRAYMQCPLTYDKQAMNLFIESLHTDLVPTAGTQFAPALEMGKKKLLEESDKPDKAAKITLLISDGEDHGSASLEAAEDLKDAGIKLFTLGIGTEKGGPVPAKQGYKKNPEGEVVISKLNNEKLKELAKTAQGNYFEINTAQNESDILIEAIAREKGDVRDKMLTDVTANLYHPFLLVAFLLLALDMLLPLAVIKKI